MIHSRLSTPLGAAQLIDQLLGASSLSARSPWRPRLQLSETEQGVIARLELAGFSKEQLDISVEQDVVTVSAKEERADASAQEKDPAERVIYTEFRSRSFSRSFSVGFEIDAPSATAKMEQGVLTIELPKSQAARRRSLSIQ